MRCKHCRRLISDGEYPVHEEGNYSGKNRCDPGDSGLPYGYNAGRTAEPCDASCLGSAANLVSGPPNRY